jgi:hypothetical protein
MPHSAESKFHRYKSHQTAAQRRSGPPANSALRRSIETSGDVISLSKAESYKMSSFLSRISEVRRRLAKVRLGGAEPDWRCARYPDEGLSGSSRSPNRTGKSSIGLLTTRRSAPDFGFAVDTAAATEERRQLLDGRGRRALLNQQVQLVQIDRFDQMMFESCFVTLADVVFHPKTG